MIEEKIKRLRELFISRDSIDIQIKEILEPAGEKQYTPKKLIKAFKKVNNELKKPTGKKWSLKYDECRGCGTTEKPHLSKGYCQPCYHQVHKKESGKKEIPLDQIKDYGCIDCSYEFRSIQEIEKVTCPKNPTHKVVQKFKK